VALLVGNATYADAPLVNPPNDVKALARVLKELGFEVETLTNTNQKTLQKGIREFGENARRAEVALFYYSGHGLQSRGENYLVPIGAHINYENDIPDETVSANSVLYRLEEAQPKAAIVVMDACRDNPVAGRTKSLSKGLIRMDAPSGTLVAYATAPGTTASDEGYYARALAKYLKTPGLDIKEVFDQVGAEVDRLSGGRQRPRKDDGLYTKVYLASAPAQAPASQPAAEPSAAALELAYWQSAQQTDSAEGYDAYLEQYPSGRYAKLARAAQAKLKKDAAIRLADGGERPPALPQSKPKPAPTRAGNTFKDCPDCPDMVNIPAGSFEMGSPSDESGRSDDEGPVHRVTLKGFALGKTEITVAEYRAFVSDTAYRTEAEKNTGGQKGCYAWDASDGKWDWRPGRWWDSPGFDQKENQPAACLSWNDAQAYVEWISRKTGHTYRLPTEAEWEYAARAGTSTARPWGENADQACGYANVADQTEAPGGRKWNTKHECKDGYWFTAPVASYRPNGFGLYDMIGNVWEWTGDCWNGSYSGAPTDGSAWTSGECGRRVLRGASWSSRPGLARAADRYGVTSGKRSDNGGFRLARTHF
jgi:formylglycine-generating enzyme required for sulfatase activity